MKVVFDNVYWADKQLTLVHPIELSHVTHRYNDQVVLSDISLSFAEHRITVILGKSGSGKSTLLQVVNGMIRPAQGTLTVFGEAPDYSNIHVLRRKMGYVVQGTGLFPHMNIQKNIALPGLVDHKPETEILTRVKILMDMVRLPLTYLSRYPHELSGGEQQRVGLCRAMLLEPPVMLMDEPFASLDYISKKGIYKYLLDLQTREARTTLLVTHDLDEAMALADDFVLIDGGKVKAKGSKHELPGVKEIYLQSI